MLIIEPHETLSVIQIADLQEQFPHIDITTQQGVRFRDALTEEGLIWV